MKCETHTPRYDMQTGGSKCKRCGILLDDFGNEYDVPLNAVKLLDRNIEWAKLYKEKEQEAAHWKALAEDLKAENHIYLYGMELLKKLCSLKHYKDTVGKDAVYEREQPKTWRESNAFIETLEGIEQLKANPITDKTNE